MSHIWLKITRIWSVFAVGKSIIENLDKEKYEIYIIWVAKDWNWYLFDENDYLINSDDSKNIKLSILK